jgi:hypothetical protein
MKLIINLFKTIAVIFGFPIFFLYYVIDSSLETFAEVYDEFFKNKNPLK